MSGSRPAWLSWLPTALVLLGLAAFGVWGTHADWKLSGMLPWLFPQPSSELTEPAQASDHSALSPGKIELAHDQVSAQAGFQIDQARRERMIYSVQAPAVLAFDDTLYAHISPRAPGMVYRVLRSVGEQVKRGDLLALILSQEVGKAKAEFLSALVQHEVKQGLLQRLQEASAAIPERQIRDAQLALREARVQLANSRQMLGNLGLTVKQEEFRGLTDDQMAQRIRTLGLPEYLGQEEDLPANLLPVVAPFDGLIVKRDLVVGEMTNPEKENFHLADIRRLWVLLDVPVEEIDQLEIGQSVTFESPASRQTVDGVLRWISAQVDTRSQTVKARADIYNPAGRLRAGMFGTARVQVQSNGQTTTVPTSAVQWDGQGRRVFLQLDEKTYEPRLVLPGIRAGGRTQLLDPRLLLGPTLVGDPVCWMRVGWAASAQQLLLPVQVGEKVVTTGSHILKSEMLKSQIGGED